MKVLITGAGGFVGHHLVDYLLKTTNWNIVITDSLKHGGVSSRINEIFEINKDEIDRVKIVVHDLSIPFDGIIRHEIGDIDVIVNVASRSCVDESIKNPVQFINNNVNLQLNILEFARTLKNLKTFIQISTDEVFGEAEDGKQFKEYSMFTPSNPYSASKAAQESICQAYWKTYDLPIVITNTMNMFGKRQSTRSFIPKTIEHLLSGKPVPVYSDLSNGIHIPCSRFYLYINNQSDAIKFLIQKYSQTPHRPSDGLKRLEKFNITDGHEFANDKIVIMVSEILGINGNNLYEYVEGIKFRPGHDTRYDLDGNKLISVGWNPPYNFYDALQETVLWTQNNQRWLKNIN